MAVIDSDAATVIQLSSELLDARDVIARQQVTILGLVVALRASQQGQVALVDLLDQVLASE